MGIPWKTTVFLYKIEVQGAIHYKDMFSFNLIGIFFLYYSYFSSKHRLRVYDRTPFAEIRKIGIPLHSPVLLYKSRV